MERFTGHFLTLLKSAGENPGLKLSELEIITGKEKEQILFQFNDTGMTYPTGKTIHQLFEEQAARTGDRIAVVSMEQGAGSMGAYLTYRELNKRAGQLAHGLRSKGVMPGIIVGIMVERSAAMIIAVTAVLKAGGAYLPLDANYPGSRIAYMLENSSAGVLVSEVSEVSKVSEVSEWGGEIVYLEDWLSEVRVSEEIPTYITHPAQPCYIIYTSGSTGKPRGVMVRHDGFVNAAFGWRKEYCLDAMEVNLLQMASFSFDVFSGDIARALLTGGKLVICPGDTRVDLPALYSLVRNHRITLFEATPSLVLPLMEYVYENQLEIPHLRLLILGSDICPVEDFKRLTARFMKGTRMRIVNSYGLTEATIDSSYYEGDPDNIPLKDSVPIGKPLPNVMFYILDPAGNLLPVGVPGELYIGGKGVAMGYLNNPELTNSRFQVPDSPLSFSASQLLRFSLYRTGDLVRWLDDGNVEFLGRVDYQVKIRGFRVELGEIEARLAAFEDIKEAVVLDKQDETGNKYLCAYIVPAEEKNSDHFTVTGLRAYLFGQLPDYMIPGHFIRVAEIPLTPNGKVDRNALAALGGDIGIGTEYAAPTNEIEETLANMWSETLVKNRVGIDDNFFDLGGQSLKAMQLVAMIKQAFDVEIPLIVFFQVGTIRGIAGLISRERSPLPDEDRAYTTTGGHSFAGVKFEKKKRRELEV
jgi:amino acid adenylation domain-containing protein